MSLNSIPKTIDNKNKSTNSIDQKVREEKDKTGKNSPW